LEKNPFENENINLLQILFLSRQPALSKQSRVVNQVEGKEIVTKYDRNGIIACCDEKKGIFAESASMTDNSHTAS
jgi:hypothetical protein